MKKAKILASCVALACMGGVTAAQAGLYVGVGGGAVRLDPDTAAGVEIEDEGRDSGLKAVIGKRMGHKGRIELFYADLGTATFTPAGEVDYSSYGINTVWDVWSLGKGKRSPNVFVSLGLGALDTEADGTSADRDNDLLKLGGLGVNFPFRHGFSLRTTLEVFDGDAAMASALLVKDFGRHHGKKHGKGKRSKHHGQEQMLPAIEAESSDAVILANGPKQATKAVNTTAVSEAAAAAEVTTAEVAASDVAEAVESVKESQPKVTDLTQLENVYFNRDSGFITEMGQAVLDQLVATMNDYPEMRVEVQGHADENEQGNKRSLSELRAQRVGNYLWQAGIVPERLSLIAYAASQPAAAEKGDRLNRRVQFRILSVE